MSTEPRLGGLRQFWRGIDWRIALMLGPRHAFTAAQQERLQAIATQSPSVVAGALLNVLVAALASAQLCWRYMDGTQLLTVVLIVLLLGLGAARLVRGLWCDPSMKRLYSAYGWGMVASLPLGAFIAYVERRWGLAPEGLKVLQGAGLMMLVLLALGLWAVATWRNEYCAQWLREQDRQAEALELARRLATAQIQPHFLFNSLAALQHWVQQKDDRAAPLLASLTGYLRSTLPLFERERLSVAEEAESAQHYLEVMQARLGDRLRFCLEIAPEAAQAQLPPGVLLTLVENAIEHGIQPRLDGGEIIVRAWLDAEGGLRLQILDDGHGPVPDLDFSQPAPGAARQGGLGLRNTLQRLRQAFGDRASLQLTERREGGCAAEVRILAAP